MKEELKNYISRYAFEGAWECTEIWLMKVIDKFFDQYQPESSKREDLLNRLCECHQDIDYIIKNCPCDICITINKMRYSEHE